VRRPKAGTGSPFLDDYLFFNSGNEVPANYSKFALLVMAAALLEARVWFDWNYSTFDANLYVGLVGPQGLRKSTAAGLAKDLLLSVDDTHPFSEPIFTKEATIRTLSQPDAKRSTTRNGTTLIYEPLTFVLFELKDSLAINPAVPVNWLTSAYDGKGGSGSNTIKRGVEKVEKPLINLLCCETTDWIVGKFRENILSGGISRRLLLVVEDDYPDPIAEPKVPKGGREAYERVKKRLEFLAKAQGQSDLNAEAREWFNDWYEKKVPPPGKFAKAWYSSKHEPLLKLAMILALADDESYKIGVRHLKTAMALLDSIEPRMLTLVAMSGRNPLLAPCYTLLGELKKGPMAESAARRIVFEFAAPREIEELLRHMVATRLIKMGAPDNGDRRVSLYRNGTVEKE